MNNLPKVSAFAINKKLENVQERFYSSSPKLDRKVDVRGKINDIFSSYTHVYKSKVRITFKDDIEEKIIIGKTKEELLTLSGEKIRIDSIIDIEKM